MAHLRNSVTANLLLGALAVAEPIKPDPVSSPTVILATRGGQPVLAAKAPTAVYPSNDLRQVWDASNRVWREEFFESEELVCTFREAFAVARDRTSGSRLFAPEWSMEMVLNGPTSTPPPSVEAELAERSLVAKYHSPPYSVLMVKTPAPELRRTLFFPCVVRAFEAGHRTTFEVIFNSSSQFLFGMLAGDTKKGMTQEVPPHTLNGLERFRMRLDPPTGEARYATTTITWDPPGSRGAAESEDGAVYVYVALDADAADGFGRELLSDDDPGRFANRSAARAFREIFRKAWDTDDPEAEKEFWQSGHHRNLDEQRHRDEELRRQVPGVRRLPKTAKSFPGIAQGAVDRHARLIASVDFGVGSLHFVQNPDTGDGKQGKVVPLALLDENSKPRLCYSLGPLGIREGEWSGLLTTPEFLSAIADYACQRR